MIHDKWYMIMMISERNHIMRGRTSRKDRWSIVFETRILERESASFCTLKRLGERDRERATCDVGLCSSRGMYERESERERDNKWANNAIESTVSRHSDTTEQVKTRQDKTATRRTGEQARYWGKDASSKRQRERERAIVRHLQMFSRKFLLLQRASAATPWRCRLQYTCTNTYINNIVEE